MLRHKFCVDDLFDLSADLRYEIAVEIEVRILHGQVELY